MATYSSPVEAKKTAKTSATVHVASTVEEVSESVRYKVFVQNFSRLVEAVRPVVVKFAVNALSKSLISDYNKTQAEMPNIHDYDRASILMSQILPKIKDSDAHFDDFVDILQELNFTKLACELKKAINPTESRTTRTSTSSTSGDSDSGSVKEVCDSGFRCPCGNCSFKSYFEDRSKCPGRKEAETFPHLNVKHLNEREKKTLTSQIMRDANAIIADFEDFASSVFEALKRNGTHVHDIINTAFSSGQRLPKPIQDKDSDELDRITTITRVETFLVRHKYISFINYRILEKIITKHCKECQTNLDISVQKLKKFSERSIFEIPSVNDAIKSPPSSDHILVVKVIDELWFGGTQGDTPNCPYSLRDIDAVKNKIAEVIELGQDYIDLVDVSTGCIQLSFSILQSLECLTFPLTTSQLSKLIHNGIIVLHQPNPQLPINEPCSFVKGPASDLYNPTLMTDTDTDADQQSLSSTTQEQCTTSVTTPIGADKPLSLENQHPLFSQSAAAVSTTHSGSLSLCSDKLSLSNFLAKYDEYLPIPIKVCRGYCGPNEDVSISEGDCFNVHFVKYTMVVTIEYDNGTHFSVPINSAVSFGLLYNPYNNLNEAMKGYKFDKVSDLLQMPTLPVLLFVRKAYQGSSTESSIVMDEVLLVRKVHSILTYRQKPQLKVYSLTQNKEKTLGANCYGRFSTKPHKVRLYLPEIIKNMPDVFPCKAVLFNNLMDDSSTIMSGSRLPSRSDSRPIVTMLHSNIETSIIVTSSHKGVKVKTAQLLDIAVDLNILVCVEEVLDKDEMQRLNEDTSFLYQNFDPKKVRMYRKLSSDLQLFETQSAFYTNILYGQERLGVSLSKHQEIIEDGHFQRMMIQNVDSDTDMKHAKRKMHSANDQRIQAALTLEIERQEQSKSKKVTPLTELHWEKLPDLPQERKHPQVVELDGKVYVGSGYAASEESSHLVYAYDLEKNKWETLQKSDTRFFAMTVFEASFSSLVDTH